MRAGVSIARLAIGLVLASSSLDWQSRSMTLAADTPPTAKGKNGVEQKPPADVQALSKPGITAPAGAKITIELDKSEYFLGENVILHWHVQNLESTPLTVDMGGDGRTPDANRAIRYKIEVTDEAGKQAPDPYPNPMNFGGMGGGANLSSGQDFWDDIQLMRYREISKPGKYTVRVYHDLGWEKGIPWDHIERADRSLIPPEPRNSPVVTTTIRFLMPTADQARKLVDAMLEERPYGGRSHGKRGRMYADFQLVRYPIYLPIAKELAQKGDARGLEMLGAMAFPEATAALMQLMQHKAPDIAAKASQLMIHRTPNAWPNTFLAGTRTRIDYLAERSWTDDRRKAALQPAWKLVEGDDREAIMRGARMIVSLGTKDDLPRVIAALDRLLIKYKDHEIEQRAYLRPPTVSDTLETACHEILKRGATPPSSTATPGNAVAWLCALDAIPKFRPAGWQETARRLMKHEMPVVRTVALKHLPLDVDEITAEAIAVAINDMVPPVQGAACDLARKAKLKNCGPALVKAMQQTNNTWVFQGAFYAAASCGVLNDQRLEICVSRMSPETREWNDLMLRELVYTAIKAQGSHAPHIEDWSSFLPDLQNAWFNFIAEHRDELRKGIQFNPASAALNRKMVTPGYELYRNGQPPWPEPLPAGAKE